MGVVEPMGLQKGSVYTFIAQLIMIYLLVLLFLLVMLVIIGNTPVLILFTAPGIFLQVVLIIYFWLFLFSLPDKSPIFKKSKKISCSYRKSVATFHKSFTSFPF